MHMILDNYGTHKTATIRRWLAKRPRFHVHFTPTSGSWTNPLASSPSPTKRSSAYTGAIWRLLGARGKPANQTVIAVVRELAGFVWAALQRPADGRAA